MDKNFKIGSFNLQNLKTNVGNEKCAGYKDEKTKRIAKIIRENRMAICALQEIQSPETVDELLKYLGPGYAKVHCADLYKALSEKYGIKSAVEATRCGIADSQKRGELAFVYNTQDVLLHADIGFYKEISDHVYLLYERFIEMVAIAVVGALAVTGSRKDDAGKDESEKDKAEESDRDMVVGGVVVSGALCAAAKGAVEKCRDNNAEKTEKIKEVVTEVFRPPLIAAFDRVSDTGAQVRLINIHSRYRFSKNSTAFRQQELAIILGDVFHFVNSKRTGHNETAFTFVAGDYNLEPAKVKDVFTMPIVREHKDDLEVRQESKSTVSLKNKKDVDEKGADPELKLVNSYDHFVFDKRLLPKLTDVETSVLEDEDTFLLDTDRGKRTLSDHYPVILGTDLI